MLSYWAGDNPDIWGNEYGDGMFYYPGAFGQRSERFPSSVIADWWVSVLDRLESKPCLRLGDRQFRARRWLAVRHRPRR